MLLPINAQYRRRNCDAMIASSCRYLICQLNQSAIHLWRSEQLAATAPVLPQELDLPKPLIQMTLSKSNKIEAAISIKDRSRNQ